MKRRRSFDRPFLEAHQIILGTCSNETNLRRAHALGWINFLHWGMMPRICLSSYIHNVSCVTPQRFECAKIDLCVSRLLADQLGLTVPYSSCASDHHGGSDLGSVGVGTRGPHCLRTMSVAVSHGFRRAESSFPGLLRARGLRKAPVSLMGSWCRIHSEQSTTSQCTRELGTDSFFNRAPCKRRDAGL